jgi:hypothetical protein
MQARHEKDHYWPKSDNENWLTVFDTFYQTPWMWDWKFITRAQRALEKTRVFWFSDSRTIPVFTCKISLSKGRTKASPKWNPGRKFPREEILSRENEANMCWSRGVEQECEQKSLAQKETEVHRCTATTKTEPGPRPMRAEGNHEAGAGKIASAKRDSETGPRLSSQNENGNGSSAEWRTRTF